MKYEFIKIENTRDGVVAYLLDHERGVVVIAPVEFLGDDRPKEVEERPRRRVRPVPMPNRDDGEFEDDIPRVVRRREVVEDRVEMELEDGAEVVPERRPAPKEEKLYDGLKDVGKSKPSRNQSIIPPHLRGLMRKDADFEKRETLG